MVEGRPTAHLCRVDLSDEIHEEMLSIEECSSKESFPPWDKKEWTNVQFGILIVIDTDPQWDSEGEAPVQQGQG